MKLSFKLIVSLLVVGFLFSGQNTEAQTKKLKRPSSRVGISSVDTFVRESFDLYNKVYRYDGYAENGKSLEDDDYEILIDAVEDAERVLATAPAAVTDLDGAGVLKQGKGTLQINRAKKALKYSLKTAKKLISEKKKKKDDSDTDEVSDTSSNDNNSNSSESSDGNVNSQEEIPVISNESDNLEVYRKYDFVPGDKPLFYDDFSNDFVGDFPSKWNTNASGEVVKITNKGNWFELKSGYGVYFIPDVKDLPEDYTIEFDILTQGIDRKTSSTARFHIILSDNNKFNNGLEHYAIISIPVGQYGAFSLRAKNYFNRGGGDINTDIKADVRDAVLNQPHIAISVTKNRYRLWVNETKYVDIPRFIQELNVLKFLKFHMNNFKDGKERLFISNLKVAKGGVDLRRKLISEGSVSTNGILFDSGSANIQPQSYGIIRQISQVLQQESNMKLKIIGHTDADGSDEVNLELSKKRAKSVKNALISIYNISGDRLQTDGKGELMPVGDNSTADGKAQNRRVEFIKI